MEIEATVRKHKGVIEAGRIVSTKLTPYIDKKIILHIKEVNQNGKKQEAK